MEKDIVVIGGGPGGYVAAIRAAQLGAKVCLIEMDKLGGTCLNRGCIPTKALYRNAELLNTLKHIDEFGINVEALTVDVSKIHLRKQGVIDQLVGGVDQLLKANDVLVLNGKAEFKDKNTIKVNLKDNSTEEITAKNIIIATGSAPSIPPIEGADSEGIYTSENILNFESIPKTLAIIGGGVIGMEIACIFNSLGTKVNVLEFLPNIIAQVDGDITKRLTVSLKKKGIEINTGTKVNKIERQENGYVIFGEGKKGEIKVEAEKLLISAGRSPMTQGLKLEAVGVDFDRKGIKVDSNYETSVKGIYAIGDVNGKVMLAHAASHQGMFAAEKILGVSEEVPSDIVPGCIFVFPEIATVGITEEEAKTRGLTYKTSKFMFGANGKALALGEGEGFVKVIASEDKIIGVHIMGPHASDIIHEGTLAIANNISLKEIKNTVHAHPTLSEAFLEAAMGINGEAIHLMPMKK
ncbi:dihydrolipoyl dehydrogenase [Candidatus Clostridium stratigraminis]|uniref:Dihydrolipoyl dehydrogenase n=1 Tax=Candidatus Clostridium stratigraminis TaxID=3381661 RepID=A0ABW8T8W4_9CLOT